MSVYGIHSMQVNAATTSQTRNTDSQSNFAEVIDRCRSGSGSDLESIFKSASQKYGVPSSLLKAVAKTESNFNSHATSRCGAMGIMQLMPSTAKSLGVQDAYDAEQNIMGGAKYISQLIQEFGGDLKLAVAAYNAGSGNVKKYGGIPPFSETQNYVTKVLGALSDATLSSNISGVAGESGPSENDSTNSLACQLLTNLYHMQLWQTMQAGQDEAEQEQNANLL